MVSYKDLNDDVLEKIFQNLEFKDLLAAELCCKQVSNQKGRECPLVTNHHA